MAVTPNLGLHQWQPGDSFLRTDFNEDFGKIDAGIGQQLKLVTGSFTTDGKANREITLGFCPRLLLIFGKRYASGGAETAMAAVFGFMCYCDWGNYNSLQTGGTPVRLTDDGFLIPDGNYFNYQTGDETYYIAFR